MFSQCRADQMSHPDRHKHEHKTKTVYTHVPNHDELISKNNGNRIQALLSKLTDQSQNIL